MLKNKPQEPSADYAISIRSKFTSAAEKNLKLTLDKHYPSLFITSLKIISGYYLRANYPLKTIKEIARRVIVDPIVEKYSVNEIITTHFNFLLEIRFKEGVVDNLARTLQTGIKDYLKEDFLAETKINSVNWILMQGKNLNKRNVNAMAEALLFNPLIEEIHLASLDQAIKKITPRPRREVFSKPPLHDFEIIEILEQEKNPAHLEKISQEKMYSLNLKEMLTVIQHYRKDSTKKQRRMSNLPENPTDVEMEILAQTWSEHCKHKIFSAKIDYYENEKKIKTIHSLYREYIQKTTFDLGRKRDDLISVFSDNAGIFAFDEKFAIAMKVETHNSPSALEPYGGAITGILGVNRDILGTGKGARPLFNTNVFCFADPFYRKKKPQKLLSPEKIFKGVHRGIQRGGNESGIPTINGAIVFDDSFLGKPLVFCGTAGILPRKIKNEATHKKKINPGDLIVMVGGRIGKDGIHGATFSSASLAEDSPTSVVQIGDSFTQKKMTDFLLAARDKDLYETLTDNGAGGLSSSIGEMATISGGAEVHLEKAILKYPHLKPWEIMVSESQERMTLAVNPKKITPLLKLAKLYDTEACILGNFTDSKLLLVYFKEKLVAQMDMNFLHHGNPQLTLIARHKKTERPEPNLNEVDVAKFYLQLIQSKNIASKENWVRQYDHEVKAGTILKPFDGINGNALMDGGAFKPVPNSKQGLIIANGILPRYSEIDAYGMAQAVVDEAVRNYLSCGGDPSKMYGLDNFCWPDPIQGPDTPDGEFKLAQLVRANMGLREILLAYNLPLISGKDSMKNDYAKGKKKISVLPTLLFTLIGITANAEKLMTSYFKNANSIVFLLGETTTEMGGSEAYHCLGYLGNELPKVNFKKNLLLYELLFQAIQNDLIVACHDLSDGGLAATLGELAWGGDVGVEINLNEMKMKNPAQETTDQETTDQETGEQEKSLSKKRFVQLFSEGPGRFLVEVEKKQLKAFKQHFQAATFSQLGFTKEEKNLTVFDDKELIIHEKLATLKKLWQKTLIF